MNLQIHHDISLRNQFDSRDQDHGRQALHMATAVKADQCVRWLKAQGFEVVCVPATTRNPRIIIRNSHLCETLEGAVRMYERLGHVEVRYWVAIRFDCEVRWTDPSTGSGQAEMGDEA